MNSLIERLEKASGPDRELDLAIQLEVFPNGEIASLTQYRRGFDGLAGMAWGIYHGGSVAFEKRDDQGRCFYNGGYQLPHYTSSLDAAMTLVPSEYKVDAQRTNSDGYACVWGFAGNRSVRAATPALALCIAALKAREAGK